MFPCRSSTRLNNTGDPISTVAQANTQTMKTTTTKTTTKTTTTTTTAKITTRSVERKDIFFPTNRGEGGWSIQKDTSPKLTPSTERFCISASDPKIQQIPLQVLLSSEGRAVEELPGISRLGSTDRKVLVEMMMWGLQEILISISMSKTN